jgi:predicted nucleic acid-binding Zn ribbon protein
MATYIYETAPKNAAARPVRFEIRQSMTESACTKHPETGEPVRRVIIGEFGYTKRSFGKSVGMVDDYRHGQGYH